jgi:hypothetical protein
LLRPEKKTKVKKGLVPEMLAKEEEVTVDGEKFRIERSILRYEALDDVLEDLPDFIKEILDK